MAVDVRSRACSYLRDGRVQVVRRDRGSIDAVVNGFSRVYEVRRRKRGWTCQCHEPDACAHVAAVKLVTGYDGLASGTGESR